MQFITYLLASIASSMGLLIGFILMKVAPEEQRPLEKYFILLRRTLIFLIVIFLIFYHFQNWLYLTALILLGILILLIEYKTNHLKREIITYPALGILFYLSSKNINLFAIDSSLILLYGLPAASLIYKRKEKSQYKFIFCSIGFVVISNLPFLVTIFPF